MPRRLLLAPCAGPPQPACLAAAPALRPDVPVVELQGCTEAVPASGRRTLHGLLPAGGGAPAAHSGALPSAGGPGARTPLLPRPAPGAGPPGGPPPVADLLRRTSSRSAQFRTQPVSSGGRSDDVGGCAANGGGSTAGAAPAVAPLGSEQCCSQRGSEPTAPRLVGGTLLQPQSNSEVSVAAPASCGPVLHADPFVGCLEGGAPPEQVAGRPQAGSPALEPASTGAAAGVAAAPEDTGAAAAPVVAGEAEVPGGSPPHEAAAAPAKRRKQLLTPGPGSARAPGVAGEAAAGRERPGLAVGAAAGTAEPAPEDCCYTVAFTREAHKKRRKFENGVLLVCGGKASLYNEEGKHLLIGKALRITEKLPRGRELYGNASTVIEIESELPMEDFTSGRAFRTQVPAAAPSAALSASGSPKAKRFRPLGDSGAGAGAGTRGGAPDAQDAPAPAGALLLAGDSEPALFLEPGLASQLRQHQRDGVCFMHRHVRAGAGCILADCMGLGKTLQALCLIWAALSRPAGRPPCKKAAVVCPSSLCANWEAECKRWLGPLRVRPTVVQGGTSAASAADTVRGFLCAGKLLIISYDQLRQHANLVDDVVDLLVCDEGHRLKSASASTTKRLAAMRCKRRVLLTGTPLQNNLDEFWCCLTFVQPTLLPPLPTFQRIFKKPIDRAQDASASAQEVALGTARSAELTQLAAGVILRRGPELLESLLPPRTEVLLTAPLTLPQVAAYRALCKVAKASATPAAAPERDGAHLGVLAVLRQLCNVDPQDLRNSTGAGDGASEGCLGVGEEHEDPEDHEGSGRSAPRREAPAEGSMQLCREALASVSDAEWAAASGAGASAKLNLLEALLTWFREAASDDGIVIVSGFTKSLERCAELCTRLGVPVEKLTGSTPIQARVEMVSAFNARRGCRAFLLSSRAGGVGLNIVGANRLIMLEPDWNPAVDLQAMGRVWRQGQTKPCFIYRLAAHGTLEEKILQRQVRKQGLAIAALDAGARPKAAEEATDMADLRRVFELDGYGPTGLPLGGGGAEAGVELPQALGLGDPVVRAALHGTRLLSATTAPTAKA
uniref:DNA repair and recombination protein RAD54B n=1 Tax=Lingulaulax polyedra TaxID=160621 RepID=A0A516AG78_LINPO|nr:DNA repair and recombination protein RAD54B [Lingulodinium polyedra]